MKAKLILLMLTLFVQHTTNLYSQQPRPGSQLWAYDLGNTVTTSPAIAPNGTIYVGTQIALYAITNLGVLVSNKWAFTVSPGGSTAIGDDGTIYMLQASSGNFSGQFYAINIDGSQKWAFSASGANGSPAISLDGTIYIEGYAYLYAITPYGTKKWQYAIGDQLASSPIIGPDGTIYIGSYGGHLLFAFSPDGTLKWQVPIESAAGDSAAVGADGTIYISGGPLYAFSPDGTNLWHTTNGDFTTASPVIGKDGTIYVGNPNDTSLWSIKPNGQTNWNAIPTAVFHPPPPTIPAIDASGLIYYCNSNAVFALNPQGQVQWVFAVPY